MKLLLERKYFLPTYTIGRLYVDGVFFSDTLEDTRRDLTKEPKIYGKTAIPEGIYKVVLSFSYRFRRILPEILDVPGFEGIRIHSGNTDEDSSGCVLLGKNNIKGMVTNSRYYSGLLNLRLKESDDITIEIT